MFENIKRLINRWSKKNYYNTKYPYVDIEYNRTDKLGTLKIDVRQFLNKNDFNYPLFNGLSEDKKAVECLTWVIDNVDYTPDTSQYKLNEYWSFGYETMKHKKGDCEDGAILLYNIMRHNGIPAWKIRISAGLVINPYTNKKEGHAYVTYYCETHDKWVVLDWCYLANLLEVKYRADYKEEIRYDYIWFSFNEEHSWSKGLNNKAKIFLERIY